MGNFGQKHLTGLAWLFSLIAILLVALLYVRKKYNKGEKYDRAVIRYTAYFMWAWEIIKTIRMVNCADYGPIGYYPLWMAPFHLCSMGLYVYLIVGSKHAGKLAEFVKPFSFAVMLLATSLILTIPASSGIMGVTPDWKFTFDNILPYQSFLYHGCLVFVPMYMILSGFYNPKWSDIPKALGVFVVCACFSQSLNYILEGSGADFMMLRYGNGSPFVGFLATNPFMYYFITASIAIAGTCLILAIPILIKGKMMKNNKKKNSSAAE